MPTRILNPNTHLNTTPVYVTPTDVGIAAWLAGFRGTALADITAIAMAESSLNINAIGSGAGSIGVTQINPQAHGQFTPANLQNLYYNLAAAYAVSNKGTNFSPWTTYKTGAYLAHLGTGETVASKLSGYGSKISSLIGSVKGRSRLGLSSTAKAQWSNFETTAANSGFSPLTLLHNVTNLIDLIPGVGVAGATGVTNLAGGVGKYFGLGSAIDSGIMGVISALPWERIAETLLGVLLIVAALIMLVSKGATSSEAKPLEEAAIA